MSTRFLFLARTSTDEMQDHESSLAWQKARAEQVIAGHGDIVDVVHDVGMSRSVPWKRRPGAANVLDRVRAGHADFDAIVVGEVARAFGSPEQAFTVLPLLTHYGIKFWAPELGGVYDPAGEASEILLGAFVGASRSERQRIKIRVKTAMIEQAKDGRFLGGRPPFGYQLADAGEHPNPAKRKIGQRLHRLDVHPETAPIVQYMFSMYVTEGMGARAISQRLTDEGIPSPSAWDPERNPHRQGSKGVWSRGAVAAILKNPKYTGRSPWGKTKGEDRLLDPEDVSMGSQRVSQHAPEEDWVWATEPTHEAIIDMETFTKAERIRLGGSRVRGKGMTKRTKNTYLLRGMVWCATCADHGRQRRLEATTISGRPLYRCRLSGVDYARHPSLDGEHPTTAAVGEARVVRAVDAWIAGLFDEEQREATIDRLLEASNSPDSGLAERQARAERQLVDAEERMTNLRQAIEQGADASLVTEWLADAKKDRDAARKAVAAAKPAAAMSRDTVSELVGSLEAVASKLAGATAAQRQKLYAAMGLRVDFTPGASTVKLRVAPASAGAGVEDGT